MNTTRMVPSDSISGSRTNGTESTLMTNFQLINTAIIILQYLLQDLSSVPGGCHSLRKLTPSSIKTTRESSQEMDSKLLEL